MNQQSPVNPWNIGEKYLISIEPRFDRIIKQYGPCLLQPRSDYFVVLCNAIISQQLSIKAAESIYNRFTTLFQNKEILPIEVLKLSGEMLRDIGCSRAKVMYIQDLAEKTEKGLLSFLVEKDLEPEIVIKELTKVKGIGRWTAEMFLIFALNTPDVMPFDDLGIKKSLQKFWGLGKLPDKDTIKNLTQSWSPYRTIAAWYLWKALENKK